jgi:hypothetical protein
LQYYLGVSKIPAAVMAIHIEELARKLSEGNTDRQIMQELNIPERTFYYRKAIVSKIYGKITERKTEEVIEAEMHVLKDRFLRLYRQLEQNIANSNDRLRDKASAAQVAADLAIQVLRLEVEGYRTRQARQAEARAAKYV